MKSRRILEQLESRHMLTGVSFVANPIETQLQSFTRAIEVGDLNGDGKFDFVAIEDRDIVWYQNDSSADGLSFAKQDLSFNDDSAHGVHLADLDDDGDLDIIASERPDDFSSAGRLSWFENLDGNGDFSNAIEIAFSEWFWLGSITTADMNGDGHLDVLLGTGGGLGGGGIGWYPNLGNGTFGDPVSVVVSESISTMTPVDMDGDGDLDIYVVFSTDFNWNLVAWFRNDGDDYVQQDIHTSFEFPAGGRLIDVDNDGDLDSVLGVSGFEDDGLGWNENLDGSGTFGERQSLYPNARLVEGFDVGDDGDTDLLVISGSTTLVLENEDGGFEPLAEFKEARNSVAIEDLDGDGDKDVLTVVLDRGTSSARLEWLEQVRAGDLDNDGEIGFADFLILSANFGKTEVNADDGDLTGDGQVSFVDFLILSSNYGREA